MNHVLTLIIQKCDQSFDVKSKLMKKVPSFGTGGKITRERLKVN